MHRHEARSRTPRTTSRPQSCRRAARASTSTPAPRESPRETCSAAAAVGRHERAPTVPWSREGEQRRLGHRVHGVRGRERLDVEDVGGLAGPWSRCWPSSSRCGRAPDVVRAAASAARRAARGTRRRCARAMAMPSRLLERRRAPCRRSPASQRLMNTDATDADVGSRPASTRRSMPRR
ncbi:MAG: hypothetical protein MZV64_04990 [Ignavibacteriales bacterium]|nr:hypothetical protein [Ignavibacteriales bacterium]